MSETADNMTAAPPPGIHRGVRHEDYHRWSAIGHSDLSRFSVSAKAARWSMTHPPEESKAMTLGSAVHAMIQPGEFERRFVREPKIDGRTKEGKAAKAAFAHEHSGKETLTPEVYGHAIEIQAALWDHPVASSILRSKGPKELSLTWDESGHLCKGRIDLFCAWDGWSNVVDLKTTRFEPTRRNLERQIDQYSIHSQLAWYRRGLAAHDGRPRRPIVIFAQSGPPYDVVVKVLDEAALEQGLRNCQAWLKMYLKAHETGVWPGCSNTLQDISIPVWAFDRSPDWSDDDG